MENNYEAYAIWNKNIEKSLDDIYKTLKEVRKFPTSWSQTKGMDLNSKLVNATLGLKLSIKEMKKIKGELLSIIPSNSYAKKLAPFITKKTFDDSVLEDISYICDNIQEEFEEFADEYNEIYNEYLESLE